MSTEHDQTLSAAPPTIDKHAKLSVGVIVERRKAGNPWQDFTWCAVEVTPYAPPLEAWSVMCRDEGITRFYAGGHEIELHPRETENYRYNLTGPDPSLYVVLRFNVAEAPQEVAVHLVTASYADAQAYMESMADQIDRVPLPAPVAEWLAEYIAAHHVERPFHKRQRKRHDPNQVGFGRRDGNGRG